MGSMSKWKCEICGDEFENFHAQGFDNKIYCPLCFFKKENEQLKEQLENKKHELNGFITIIAKYLEIEEVEHTTYDEIIEKLVNLKGAKQQLQQRDEVIEEAIKAINESEEFQILEAMALNIDQAILMKVLSILYKYKGDSNE